MAWVAPVAWVGSAACWAGPEWATAYATSVQDLIDALGRLPGVGPKSAQRIAFHLLKVDAEEANRLARAIVEAKERVGLLPTVLQPVRGRRCAPSAPTTAATCTVVCVVEEPRDVVAIERTREFRGRYHVLQGAIDHLQGVGPEQLKIRELLARVGGGGHHRGDHLHQPQPRGRGHRAVPHQGAGHARPHRVAHRRRACRWAATWSTPTSSRSAGRWRVAASSATKPRPTDATVRAPWRIVNASRPAHRGS